jgi:type I site-specific restriction endonuclease
VIILTESKTQYKQLKGVIRMEENKERLERIKSDFSIFDWLIELAEKRIESNLG